MASAQLELIYSDHTWKLDRRTVQIGRAGVAQARAALAAATIIPLDDPTDTEAQHSEDTVTHQAAA